ncbi:hypothetical protein [Kitasatospora kifunensis]|uniref:Uncharacterized protein n=1 Tax=Kitasatospora kifunensis TaxID=58351 RepID=A0A7W7RC55_KITKI|nr:hypothetical protein [Kitasatospora kifunensis]MBB4929120.1 hypothetical protein [Kitasatospora kifunensis]
MEFHVPEVPQDLHPAACWRRAVTALDPAAHGGYAVIGDWLHAGDTVDLPADRLVITVDKATTGWKDGYRSGERYPVESATVTVYRIGQTDPVWQRHYKQATSAIGATTLKKLTALLEALPVPDGAPVVVNEVWRPNLKDGDCRWCGTHLSKRVGHTVGHGDDAQVEHYRQCPDRQLDPTSSDLGTCELCGVEVVFGQAQLVLLREGAGRWAVLHNREFGTKRMCEVAPVPSPAEQAKAAEARRAAEQAQREKEKAAQARKLQRAAERAAAKRAAAQAEQERVAGLATVKRTTENVYDKGLGNGRRARMDKHLDLLEDDTTTERWSVSVYYTSSGWNGEDYDPAEDEGGEWASKDVAHAHYKSLKWEPDPQPTRPSTAGGRCANCNGPGARHQRVDSSGIPGSVCDSCDRDDDFQLSFA